jgi:hypothetical protein
MTLTKKTKQILIGLVLAGAVIGGWAIWYVFFKPHRDVSSEKPAFTMTAEELNAAFEQGDGTVAKYIDQAMMIEGEVTEVNAKYIALGNIICNFEETSPVPESVAVGQKVKVQGRVSTYNDLMGEIVLDKCAVK